MFEDLNQCLSWNTNDPPQKCFVLITSEETDGGFFIHHFISLFLKQKLPVCLVTLAQTFSHYAQAGIKIGTNLDKAKAEGTICHIDLTTSFLHNVLDLDNHEQYALQCKWTAENMFQKIKSDIEKTISKTRSEAALKPALLVLDDMSVLTALGMPLTEVKNLLHYLTVLSKSEGFLLVTVIPTFLDENCSALQTYAAHSAETVIEVKALPSGYSKDVHGHLKVLKGKDTNSIWQYKLTDKTLHLFAKGMSSAVL